MNMRQGAAITYALLSIASPGKPGTAVFMFLAIFAITCDLFFGVRDDHSP